MLCFIGAALFASRLNAIDHNAGHAFGAGHVSQPTQGGGIRYLSNISFSYAPVFNVVDEIYLELTFHAGVAPSLSFVQEIALGTAAFTPAARPMYSKVAADGRTLQVWYGLEDVIFPPSVSAADQLSMLIANTAPVDSIKALVSYHNTVIGKMPDLDRSDNLVVATAADIDSETGATKIKGVPLSPANGGKIIVLVHGWNTSASGAYNVNHYARPLNGSPQCDPDPVNPVPDILFDKWTLLAKNLMAHPVVEQQHWAIARYDWYQDAATGHNDFDNFKIQARDNANAVRDAGNAHGLHLGQLLSPNFPAHVHFICHSAGNWVARRAAAYLRYRFGSNITLQITALDPFVNKDDYDPLPSDLNLQPDFEMTPLWVNRLDNYYVVDKSDGLKKGLALTPWTSGDFSGWQNQSLESLNFIQLYDKSVMEFHGGPVQWYALSAAAPSTTGATGSALHINTALSFGFLNSLAIRQSQPNDNFASAAILRTTSTGSTTWFNYNATPESNEPDHTGTNASLPYQSVWGVWTAPLSGSTTFKTTGSDFDTVLAIYTGNTLTSLTRVAQNTAPRGTHESVATFTAVAGQSYRIAVDGAVGAFGKIALAWEQTGAPAPVMSITAPAAGATLSGSVTVSATVSTAVTKVEFWLDNVLKSTDTAAPFSWTWDTTQSINTTHTLRAVAYGGQNETVLGVSASVNVTVSNGSGGNAPVITFFSPSVLTGLPLPLTQPVRILGSGFTTSSTLTFNDGVNPSYTGRRPIFVSANELDYNIAVGTNAATWTVQVVNGSQQSTLKPFSVATAPPPTVGSLSVTLLPAGAVSAGAQWRVDSGAYHSSGEVVTGLTPGLHFVSCKSIGGYDAPASRSVNIVAGTVTPDTETYTAVAPTTYTLTLTANNTQGFIVASPTPTNGTYPAGTIVKLTASANYGYQFTNWSGDVLGAPNPTSITLDRNKSATANFIAGDPRLGTVKVTILPPEAAAAGVTWGFNANDYRTSGSSYTTFPSDYILTLHPVDGWLGSPNIVATVTAGQTTNVTATFTADTTPGYLTVTLSPPDAVTAGAHWHANGSSAQSSGASLSVAPGSYTVTFDPVAGWTAPPSQTVQVQRAQTAVLAAAYTPPAGQPGITSVQPSVGALAGGTPLTIQGMNFVAPATVLVGGKAATNVTVVSSSQITCQTPAGTVYGTASVVVQTSGGSATNQNGFAYGLPRGNGIVLAGGVGGYVNAVAAQGNYCYMGEGSTFTVLDISNSSAPTPVGRLAMPGLIQDIALFTVNSHQYAAVANDDAGLQIVDLASVSAPALRGYYASGDHTYGVAISGTYACVGDGSAGFKVLDVSDPAKPQLVGSVVPSSSFANRMSIQTVNNQRLAYLVNNGGLQIVDVTSFTNPTLRGSTAQLLTRWYQPNSIAVSGNRAFMADGSGYLQTIDVSNPDNLAVLSVTSSNPSAVCIANGLVYAWGGGGLGLQIYNLPGGDAQRVGYTYTLGQLAGSSMAVVGGKALCSGGEAGLYVYDVSTASNPSYRGAYGATAGYYNYAAISGNYAWFASQNNGLKAFNISNPAAPVLVSQYRASYNAGYGGEGVKVTGNRAYYLASGQINVLDVSNPSSPVFLGATSQSTFYVQDLYIVGTSILVCGSDTTVSPWKPSIAVFNASNPAAMSIQAKLALSTGSSGAIAMAGNSSIACVAVPTTGNNCSLAVVDVSVAGTLRQIGQLSGIGVVPSRSLRLAPDGQHLYVGGYTSADLNWKVIDLTNTSAPAQVSSTNVGTPVAGFDFTSTTVLVATWRGLLTYDVSDPSHPQLQRSYNYPTPSVQNDVKIFGNYLYGTDGGAGLSVLALSDNDPPVVAVTSPAATSTSTSATISMNGTAVDSAGLVRGSVSQVTWANSRGGGGNATGTSSWSVSGITLQPGANVLTVTATDNAGNSGTAVVTVTYQLPKQNQTITFTPIADHMFGDPPIPLVAAASSGASVQFSVTSGAATIAGNLLTLTGAGAVTVRASQPGNDFYNAAQPVDVTFNVARANQAIAFAPPADCPASVAPFTLTATANSGLQVYFNVVSGPAVVSGNVMTVLAVGSVVVNAWQPGSSNYNAATAVQRSFNVTAIPQTIMFGILSGQRLGDAPFAVSATATSGLPVSFSVRSGPATVLGNIVTITGAGTVVLRASQSGDSMYSAADDVDRSFLVVEAPTITTQPSGQTVNAGVSVTFTVVATGTAPLNYQWRKGGVAIGSATNASFTLSSAQPADTGSYDVVVNNGVSPDATSDVAKLNVVPAGVAATHRLSSYTVGASGRTAVIANQFSYTGALSNLQWSVLLPSGWSLASTDAIAADAKPAAGKTDLLEWRWTALPASPVNFAYSLNIPTSDTVTHPISALVGFKFGDTPIQITAKLDPLNVGAYHSADTMGDAPGTAPDGKINLAELLRVIELYNYRPGTVRTGQYTILSGTEDGFTPGPNGLALTRFHSADTMGASVGTPPEGKLNLAELLRVIELYNYRAGTVRTGQYRLLRTGETATDDGFAPGP